MLLQVIVQVLGRVPLRRVARQVAQFDPILVGRKKTGLFGLISLSFH